MAIYRTIQMSFWTDRKVVEDFTPEDRYFYLYLFTNPHTNLAGCYELGYVQASYELGYNKETISKLIDRFKNVHRVIDYDDNTREILLINWHKFNWTKSEKLLKPLGQEIERTKTERFKSYLEQVYEAYVNDEDTVSIPYPYGMDTSVTVTDTVTNTITVNKYTKEEINKEEKLKKPKEHKESFGEYGNVKLTQKQREKLDEDYGFEMAIKMIEYFDSYIQEKGYKTKDHNLTMRRWVYDAVIEREQKGKFQKKGQDLAF